MWRSPFNRNMQMRSTVPFVILTILVIPFCRVECLSMCLACQLSSLPLSHGLESMASLGCVLWPSFTPFHFCPCTYIHSVAFSLSTCVLGLAYGLVHNPCFSYLHLHTIHCTSIAPLWLHSIKISFLITVSKGKDIDSCFLAKLAFVRCLSVRGKQLAISGIEPLSIHP